MRLWQIHFQVIGALESLPVPMEIVYEKQTSPAYHIEECRRPPVTCAQIVCTVRGEGAFRSREEVTRLTPGTAFLECLCSPEIAYYYPSHATEPWEFIWFSFSGKPAADVANELIRCYGHIFRLPLDQGFVKHLEAFRAQRDSLQLVTPTEGAKIVADVLAAFGETMERKLCTSPQAQLVQAAQEMILSNTDRALDIALIAKKLHVTREHLTRVFHSQTGKSPGQFSLENRMRVASRLLLDNTLSCKEIAERIGYESASSFARVFKSYFHLSPAQYKSEPSQTSAVTTVIGTPDRRSEDYEIARALARRHGGTGGGTNDSFCGCGG